VSKPSGLQVLVLAPVIVLSLAGIVGASTLHQAHSASKPHQAPVSSPSGVSLVTKSLNGRPSGFAYQGASLSSSGRYASFVAAPARSLAKGVSPYCQQIYWRDMKLGVTKVASQGSSGTIDNASCQYAGMAMSGDGRYVAFTRPDATMTPVAHGNSGWHTHFLFIKDMTMGSLMSYPLPAAPKITHGLGDRNAVVHGMSADGRYTTVSVDYDGGFTTTYSFDRTSRSWAYTCEVETQCLPQSVSADGRFVSLLFQPHDVTPPEAPAAAVWDRNTGKVTKFQNPPATTGYGPSSQVVSPDGKLYFSSYVSYSPSEHYKLVIYRLTDRHVVQVLENRSDVGPVQGVSYDGRYLVSPAYDKAASSVAQAFRFDRLTLKITLGSVSPKGKPANRGCWPYALSSDGSKLLFSTTAFNLVPGDSFSGGDNTDPGEDYMLASLPT
jgi:hypothetical protein